MKKQLSIFNKTVRLVLCLSVMIFAVSCEETFEFELPEAGSIVDKTPPVAAFAYQPDPEDFRIINFNNLSIESTNYNWDFGDGNTSTEKDPIFRFDAGEGTYQVTLTSRDANGASTSITVDVVVQDVFVPLPVTILNGDFDAKRDHWNFASFTGGTTLCFNDSSDGSFTNYDGTDNGAKTRGAKWTYGTSAGPLASSSSRIAYQAILVSPSITGERTVRYILEYEYAIKTPAEQADAGPVPGGNRIISVILGQHFSDGADAVASSPVSEFTADAVLGKTVHTKVKQEFVANYSGEMAIMFYAVTGVDSYIDNVKVYAAD